MITSPVFANNRGMIGKVAGRCEVWSGEAAVELLEPRSVESLASHQKAQYLRDTG